MKPFLPWTSKNYVYTVHCSVYTLAQTDLSSRASQSHTSISPQDSSYHACLSECGSVCPSVSSKLCCLIGFLHHYNKTICTSMFFPLSLLQMQYTQNILYILCVWVGVWACGQLALRDTSHLNLITHALYYFQIRRA